MATSGCDNISEKFFYTFGDQNVCEVTTRNRVTGVRDRKPKGAKNQKFSLVHAKVFGLGEGTAGAVPGRSFSNCAGPKFLRRTQLRYNQKPDEKNAKESNKICVNPNSQEVGCPHARALWLYAACWPHGIPKVVRPSNASWRRAEHFWSVAHTLDNPL